MCIRDRYEYAQLVSSVRKYWEREKDLTRAIDHAIEECIRNNILAEFLRKNRAEVVDMLLYEYDEEEFIASEKELSFAEGEAKGRAEGRAAVSYTHLDVYKSQVKDFVLAETVEETEKPGRAILVLGKRNQTYASRREFERHAICPGKENIPVAEIGAEATVELQIYGKVAADFYGAYQFTVRPTLKISTVKAR